MENERMKLPRRWLKFILKHFRDDFFLHYQDDTSRILMLAHERGYAPMHIIDVGAYEGKFTLSVLDIFPDTHVYMFEPQESKRKALERICSDHSNVTLNTVLLDETKREDVPFYLMESGSSILFENTTHRRTLTHIDTDTLDSFFTSPAGDYLIKHDTQGYELSVLNGGKEVLKHASMVIIEASLVEYNIGAPTPYDIMSFMHQNGFVLYELGGMKRNATEKLLFQFDMFFCRNNNPLREIRDFSVT